MKRLLLTSAALLTTASLSPAQLTIPKPGFARFQDGSIHAVFGVPNNLLTNSAPAGFADALSFSDIGGLTANKGLITLRRADGSAIAEYESDEPQPVLNIDGTLTSAVAWLPSRHLLLRWDGTAFSATAVSEGLFDGRVSFVQLSGPTQASLLVVNANGVVTRARLELNSGRLIGVDMIPGAHGATMALGSWTISQNENGFDAESANGQHQAMQLTARMLPSGDLTVERMSTNWLHVWSRSGGTHWAVLLSPAQCTVSQLAPPKETVQ